MMYMLKLRKPELVEKRDLSITLRSDKNIAFNQEKLNSEIFVKAPHVRGDNLWKQLPSEIPKQHSQMGPRLAQLGSNLTQLGPIWNAA